MCVSFLAVFQRIVMIKILDLSARIWEQRMALCVILEWVPETQLRSQIKTRADFGL